MKKTRSLIATLCALALPAIAAAHFQTLIPSLDIVGDNDPRSVQLDIRFTHPMENGPLMNMAPPKQFGVLARGERQDLLPSLKAIKRGEATAYQAEYALKHPADHVFFIEPAPYWEPAEEKMIIHYTKVVVDAFGAGEGWDAAVGFPVEIEPLTRPYGLWTGNAFQGIVRHNGQPVPFAEIEIEYLNDRQEVKPPAEPFITQVVKTDANGVFAYTMPRAGWWSFAALIDGPEKMKNPDGKMVDVELGALIWVKTTDMK